MIIIKDTIEEKWFVRYEAFGTVQKAGPFHIEYIFEEYEDIASFEHVSNAVILRETTEIVELR